jgi:hypothetical protein
VFLRTQNISMARIRDAEFKQLQVLQRSSALSGLMFLHLKKDLEMKHVDWVDSRDPYDSSANSGSDARLNTLTTYGMPKGIQTQLAGLRTDLDTFAEAEAYALMLSGYRMASAQFPLPDLAAPKPPREPWRFLAVEPVVDRATDYEPEHERLKTMLEAGRRLSWKVWYVRPAVAVAALISLLSAMVIAALAIRSLWIAAAIQWQPPARAGWIALTLAAAAAAYLVILWRTKRKSATVIATGLLLVTIGWLVARVHLWVFDPIYRRAGSIAARTARAFARAA